VKGKFNGKVVFLGGFELPNKNAAAHRIVNNAKIFRFLNYKPILIGVSPKLKENDGIKIVGNNQDLDMREVNYPSSIKQWISRFYGERKILDFINTEKDIHSIVLYNYPAIASCRIMLLAKRRGIKVICDIAEWHSSKGSGFFYSIIKWLDTVARIRFISKKSDGIITISNYMTRFYKEHRNVVEIPTLFDSNEFVELVRGHEDKIKFIYFGSPFSAHIAKNNRSLVKERMDKIILVADSYRYKYKFEFNIYGITKEEYLIVYPEHVSMIEKLIHHVYFHGKVDNQELRQYIKEADYSIFFRDESLVNFAGFPSKFAESYTLGTPVITNKLPNLEGYNNLDGVFLLNTNNILNEIESIFNISLGDRECMRKNVDIKVFDYNSYIHKVKQFVNNC
jgi:hypothetical protein